MPTNPGNLELTRNSPFGRKTPPAVTCNPTSDETGRVRITELIAQEASWREDNRRVSNGEQVSRLAGLALKAKPSVDFNGYWQRHVQA